MTAILNRFEGVRRTAGVLRLRPFDTGDSEGRSLERYRRAALTSVSAIAAKGMSLVTMVVSVPLCMNYLGAERYGIWMTIVSTITMISFADLGIGNGVVNAIANARGTGDPASARRVTSSGLALLSAVAFVLLVALFCAYPHINWGALFNSRGTIAKEEVGLAVLAFGVCFAVGIPLGVVLRVQIGLQEGYVAHLWTIAGNVASLSALVLAVRAGAGLPWLLLAVSVAPLVATAASGWQLFTRRHPELLPHVRDVELATARSLLRAGAGFFVLQLAVAVGYQSDNFVVARVLGPAHVPEYAIPARLFGIAPLIVSTMTAPLWPAYGEAIARGDAVWVRRTLRRSILLSAAIDVSAAVLLLAGGPSLLRAWTGTSIPPSHVLLVALAVFTCLHSVTGPLSALLNGAGVLKLQAVPALAMAAINVPLSFYLTREIGVAGVVVGSIVSQLICVIGPTAFVARRVLRSVGRPAVATAVQPTDAGCV